MEAKKNKKGKKGESVDDFPGRENIRFGEVVQAPPKLVAPKVVKNFDDRLLFSILVFFSSFTSSSTVHLQVLPVF